MIIKTYPIGIYEENIYVLVDEKSKDACIVDPGGNGDLLIKNIEELGCNIKYILLTHGHFDHVEALNEVAHFLIHRVFFDGTSRAFYAFFCPC